MVYSKEEVIEYVKEEDVKFIRLVFCDIYGKQKNISIMPNELTKAFTQGIAIDASAIEGFCDVAHSDLFLHPDPNTISVLPWRPEHGMVVRMFCNISHFDGTPYENDTRKILIDAVNYANLKGYDFFFGPEIEFYLFKIDELENRTYIPYDEASYMDVAPEDKGENVRREICLTLERMEMSPEASHHEEGPGQNEIDFRYSDPLNAADNALTFKIVVKTIAAKYGLFGDLTPKPLLDKPGNSFHINMSLKDKDGNNIVDKAIPGILKHIKEITAILNSVEDSYKRLGNFKAPKYISWSKENRSSLIRIPLADDEHKRIELRSADPMCNPYLAFALLIYASIESIENNYTLVDSCSLDLFSANATELSKYDSLPSSIDEAKKLFKESKFVNKYLPKNLISKF